MKAHEDCRPCLLRQMEATARIAGADEKTVEEVLRVTREELDRIWDDGITPPELSTPLYQAAGAVCGSPDPWLPKKVQYTREALKLLPDLASIVDGSEDPFEAAVRLSIAGNVIDFGTGTKGDERIDLPRMIREFLVKETRPDDTPALRRASGMAETILFVGDNAGETVFDRPLLSLLEGKRLIFAARGGPIINDATVKDAVLAGVGLHAEIVDTGAVIPGVVPDRCSREFMDVFSRADLVIAKGQGNFETLSELPRSGRIFFLFVIKCPLAARHVGGEVGDMVVIRW